jgi:hypothetical protein
LEAELMIHITDAYYTYFRKSHLCSTLDGRAKLALVEDGTVDKEEEEEEEELRPAAAGPGPPPVLHWLQ